MKNIVLIVAFLFATSSIVNANNKVIKETEESNLVEATTEAFFGCASDCVRVAKDITYDVAEANEEHHNDDPSYLQLYLALYSECYFHSCGDE